MRANLTQQNDDLREENHRLQEQRAQTRSRNTRASSRSRTSRSTSRRSRSDGKDNEREKFLDNNLVENFQVGDNLQEERECNSMEDRYVQVDENEPRQRRRREGRPGGDEEYNRMQDESEQVNDAEQSRMILHGREMLRQQRERDNAAQEHARNERERRRRRREDAEQQELEEVVRQSIQENRLRQARFKRPMQQQENPFPNNKIMREITELRESMEKGKDGGRRQLEEAIEEAAKTPFARQIQLIFRMKGGISMAELHEYQEEYIALEEKQIDMESYPVAVANVKEGNASLLRRIANTIARTSQGVASTYHQCIKFPLPHGVGIIRGNTAEAKTCNDIDVEKSEGRANKRRNWKKEIEERKRGERLMVDFITKEEEVNSHYEGETPSKDESISITKKSEETDETCQISMEEIAPASEHEHRKRTNREKFHPGSLVLRELPPYQKQGGKKRKET
ncbi:trichohyalin-like [Papaver somniferum]|uniref:trichohyalin-like n=1 Tax=Papaver somniferum TaxID=3469 RepID=UPI000E6F4CC3|nr:trichohyalin-like [Papaver somniferum]